MADERLEVLLKARIDPTSQKNLQVQATAVGEKLEPIDLDVKIDTKKAIQSFSELKKVMTEVTSLAKQNEDGILGNAVDIQAIEKFKNAFGKTVTIIDSLIKKVDEFGNETIEVSTEITKNNTSLEKQNQLIDKASKLQNELNLARQKFDIVGQADIYKLGNNLNVGSIENLRDRFKNIEVAEDGSNLDETLNNIKLINKEYDSIIADANLNKKINDDIAKQNADVVKQKEKELKLYQEIKIILDKLPSSAIGTNDAQDLYSLLDSTTEIKDLQALKDITKQYYNESITGEKELTNAQKLRSQSIKETFNDYKKIQDISTKADKGLADLNSVKTSYSGANVQDFERLENAWKNIRIQVENGNMDFQEANNEIKKLTNSTKDFETASKKASSATNSLGDRLKKAFQYFTFYDAINLGKRALESMVEVIFDLDDALVELRKVSDLSGDSLKGFVQEAYNLGGEISKTGSEIIRASTQWAKAGYADEELLNLAEASLKLTSIGDGLTSAADATDTLISVLRGYKKETSELEFVMDSINNVSNNAAVNFSDLTTALQRNAGAMNASGVSLAQTLGLFTGINEVLRNTEISSTAINSISMRIRGLSESGEKIDGLAPKMASMFKDIANIDITDSAGQVDNLYEIAGKLAPIWDTLTENQKQYISQEASGIRQSKAFLVMMDNYDRVLETTALAYNSAGSAEQEFIKWQDSLEGRMNNLKSSIEMLASETVNSNFIKALISATTSVINFSTACGGAIPVVASLGLAFLAFQKGSLVSTLFAGAITQVKLLTTTTIGAVGAVTALQMALGVGFVVAGILGVSYVINSISEKADKAKEAISTLSGELEDLKSKSSSVESLGETYISLKGIDDKTNDQLNEYYDVQNKIKELMPEISGFYNEQGNFIIENVNNLTDLTSIQKEYIKLKREELALASKENMNSTVKSYEESTKNLDYLQWLKSINMLSKSGEVELKETADKVKQYTTDMSDSILQVAVSTQNWANLTEDEANAVRKAYAEISDDKKQDYAKQIEENTFNTQEFINTLSEYPSAIKYMETATKNATIANNELASSFLSVEDGLKKLTSISSDAEKINTILKSLNKGDEVSANDIETLLGISDEYLLYLGDETKLREKLTQSMSDYADSYEATYNQMLGTSAEYYQTKIKDDADTRKKLENNISDYFKTLNLKYNEDLKEYTDFENAKGKVTLDVVKQIAGVWREYFDANGNLISDSMTSELADKKLSPFISDSVLKQSNEKVTSELQVIQGKIWQARAGYDALVKDIAYVPVSMDFDKNESSSKDKTDAWKEAFEKQYKELQYLRDKSIISSQQYYDTLDSLNNKYFANQTKYLDEYRQYDLELYNLQKQFAEKRIKDKEFEISLLDFNGGEDTTSKQIAIYEQMQSEVHALAQKARSLGIAENDEYLQNLKTQYIDYSNKILDLSSETYDKANKKIADSTVQIELKQQLVGENSAEYLELEKQKYDNKIATETILQKRIAELQAIGTKNAKDEAEDLINTYYDTVSERYDIIKNLQSIDIANLEKQKDAIESIHEYTMDMIKEELEAKKKSYQDEIDEINDVFDARKKAILGKEDTDDYNKGLSEKTSVVADLENQLAIIKNDETAVAKRKALESELTKAREDLADYQHDREIDLTIDALDERQKLETDALQSKIDGLDETLSSEVKMNELANNRIEKSGKKLYSQLIDYAEEYGTITKDEIKNAWDDATSSINGYKTSQEGLLETLKLVTAELSKIDGASVQDYAKSSGLNTRTDNDKLTQMKLNSTSWTSASEAERKRLAEENQRLGKELGLIYESSTGIWWRDKAKKIRAFHEGGIVGGSQYATKSTEELVKVLKGEPILTQPMAARALDMITNNSNSNVTISMPIVIEGNADSDTVKALEKQIDKLADKVIGKLNTARNNTGFKKKPSFI